MRLTRNTTATLATTGLPAAALTTTTLATASLTAGALTTTGLPAAALATTTLTNATLTIAALAASRLPGGFATTATLAALIPAAGGPRLTRTGGWRATRLTGGLPGRRSSRSGSVSPRTTPRLLPVLALGRPLPLKPLPRGGRVRLRGGPVHRPPALQPRLRPLTFRRARLRSLSFRRPGLRRSRLRRPGLRWPRLRRAGGSCSRLVAERAGHTRLSGQLVAYAGVLRLRGDLGGAGGQLLGAAVDVVERAAARPGQGFDDLRVVVDRVECPAQECHQLLQAYP